MKHGEMPFALSARTPAALRENAGRLARWLTEEGAGTPPADVAHTLARRRAHLTERLVVRAADRDTLTRLLATVAEGGEPGPLAVRGSVPDTRGTRPVFVFSGHGSQWDGMGTRLLAEEPAFAAVIDTLEPVVRQETGLSLRALITEDGLAASGMDRVQPAVHAVQVGLAAVWRARGIHPGAVIGHSLGEVAAAVVAGALSPEDGARVVCRRSRLMEERLAGSGATALVGLNATEVRGRLAGRPGVSVAVHSSPRACVVAGVPEAVAEFVAECREQELLARLVPGVRIGAHSPLVDPLLDEVRAALAGITPGRPDVPYYGCTLDDPRERPALDAAYWAASLRRPVRLTEAVEAAVRDGRHVFLEVSPHPVVAQSVLETLLEADGTRRGRGTVLGTLARGADCGDALADTLAALHCAGVTLPREAVPEGRPVALPTYAWQHQSFPRPRRTPVEAPGHPLLGHRVTLPGTPVRHVWQNRVDTARLPWLTDHRVHGTAVLPGTAYAELVLAAACEAFGAAPGAVAVSGLVLARLLPLTEGVTLTTTLEEGADGTGGTVTVVTGAAGTSTTLATARVTAGPAPAGHPADHEGAAGHGLLAAAGVPADDGLPPTGREGTAYEPADVYAALRALGQEHGPAFASLTEVRVADGTATSRVTRPAALPPDGRFHLEPALLDACLHGLGALVPAGTEGTYLPTGVAELRFSGHRPATALLCRARLRPGAPGVLGAAPGGPGAELWADVRITDESGAPVAELTGVRLGRVGEEALPVDVAPLLHGLRWDAVEPPPPRRADGQRLLVAGGRPGDPARAALLDALTAAGASCRTVDRDDAWDGAWDVHPLPAGVVLTAWEGPVEPVDVAECAERRVRAVLRAVSGILRACDEAGTPPPPLTVLTDRGQRTRDAEAPDPAQTALRGVVRTLRLERPGLRARIIDLDGSGALPADEILATDGPDEVAWRDGVRLAATLVAEAPPAPAPGRERVVVRPGGGYLVTGGTRGLGLATARWLAENGAGAVVLGGRGAPAPDAAEELARIRAMGTRVELVPGDIAEPGTAERMLGVLAATGAAPRGVVHTAAVIEDAVVTDPDPGRLHRIWAPKAAGAWRLHEATKDAALDWWVGFSSLASLTGSPGQSAYAAANAFLDGVVALRRSAGLPALTVNWGPWGEVGAVRDRTVPGLGMLTVREGFAALETLLARGTGQAGVARLVPGDFLAAHPAARHSSFFSALTGAEGPDDTFDRAALAAMTSQARSEAVRSRTLLSVGRVLGFTDPAGVADRPLVHLGLDSLAAVRIKSALYDDFAVDVPVARLLQGASATDLADQVTRALADGEGPDRGAADAVRDAARRAGARTRTARPRRRGAQGRNA
ncbi:SDR family NAD(P)-dependent oxidoreductase [Streptomyces sp. NPDC016309]|uniref:SDR family NAD(P)-dependent oxidoreductase n=1 Tax=Streptomyces sp. NPDC016309 TaxID=3364965 RepID=UPI0036F9F504